VSITTPGGELAQLEFRRLSTVAWLAIAGLYSVLALTAQFPISAWQLYYAGGILLSIIVSKLFQKTFAFEYSFLPMMIYLLVAPILLGSTPVTAWMSYGVLTIFANLYIATVFQQNYSIAIMFVITIFQIWVLNLDLTSISDLADMRLLNTYFSSLWTFGSGIAFMFIRQRYLESSEKIEVEIDRLKERISARFQAISLQNREDYRNLKLHGTILNTLIFAKNNPEFATNRQKLFKTIQDELMEIRSDIGPQKSDLEGTLKDLLDKRTLTRINISRLEVSGRLSDVSLENNILEIIREILLNLEKHTLVAEVQIELQISGSGDIFLRISESAHHKMSSIDLEVRKKEALRSASLNRLLAITPSQLAITSTSDGFGLIYTVTNLEAADRTGDSREIYRLRNLNLIDFAEKIGRATAIFGLLFLPGYLLLGIPENLLILLIIHSTVVAISLFKKSRSKGWLTVSAFFSLILPVLISQDVNECSNISYLPWLLNVVMMNAFIFAIEIRNQYLRWVPIAIITIEMFLLPTTYPYECRGIFLGSLPAIPMIIIFALVLASIRRRLYNQDAEQISSVFVDESKVEKYEDALENEYRLVIKDLEVFNGEILTIGEESMSTRLENEIQKIRAFLVCSEQFESVIIRQIYGFVIARLRDGVPTRLNVLGDFFYQLDPITQIEELLTDFSIVLNNIPCEISVVKLADLTFDISVESKFLKEVSSKTELLTHALSNISVYIHENSN
jgi:hypothetical protein